MPVVGRHQTPYAFVLGLKYSNAWGVGIGLWDWDGAVVWVMTKDPGFL